nr:5-formyltetrahydrofolate cyclo-ligase [Lysinibacillus timonensis]
MDKKDQRNHMKQLLDKMSDHEYKQHSASIMNYLLQEPIIKNAETIGLTISNKPEVDTYLLIKELWSLSKRVAVPKCNPEKRTMDFYEIQEFSQLETVYMNLKEPNTEQTSYIAPRSLDVIIVPGIVYDLKGFRIGYGGGYYDRYNVNYNGKLISLAFDFQIVEEVPKEQHDIPVDLIITELRKINCTDYRKESFK